MPPSRVACAGMNVSTRASMSSKVTALCRLIEQSEQMPTLGQLAEHVGLSTFYTQRVFKAAMGITPRAYAAALRAARLRVKLGAGESVTQAVYQSGYNSSGRFYADSNKRLGMTPSAFKAGAPKARIRFAVGCSTLGDILVAATELGVCAIMMGDDPSALLQDLEHRFPRAELLGADASFQQLVAKVVALVERPRAAHAVPLDICGTAFQERVWRALVRIPAGTTLRYAELAAAIGQPSASRAVAGACAANALAVAIPCHRVVRTDGSLSGYRWGVERKRELLARERE